MCKCTPEIRTPFCGKPGCQWPPQRPGAVYGGQAPSADGKPAAGWEPGRLRLSDPAIRRMVDRFLAWRLPADFHPDGGVTYTRLSSGLGPIGTNLLDATQAEAMVRFMVEGLIFD